MKVLYGAHIYTLDANQPTASAIAIDGDRILSIGNDAEILAEFNIHGVAENMNHQTIIPGLTDAHFHLETYALGRQKVDCETSSRHECLARVAERARSTPPGEWILGHGWNQNDWEAGFGSASDLDAVTGDHPVYLSAKSLHAGWANTLALRLAGIDAHTADPAGGALGRDAQGNPNGILFESAMALLQEAIPAASIEAAAQAIRAAQSSLWQVGLTGVHDFDQKRCFSALQILQERGELNLRVIKSIPLHDLPQAAGAGLRTGFGNDFLRIGATKAFTDGALGPHTAAMLQPYEDDPQNMGMLLMDAEELYEQGRIAVENRIALAVHAIGDRANHEVINAFKQLRAYERSLFPDSPLLRHRIEHVQLLHPDDAPRLNELSLIASMQPIHATSDMLMADRCWGKRSALAYAWRSQLRHGAILAFGSDAPVESPNPFWGLHAAVTRKRRDNSPGPQGWYPEQRLTTLEALRAYTSGAAYAAGQEKQLGKLAPGFLADLVVLDADPFACQADQLANIRPTGTMIGGQWVYRA